MSDIVSVEFSSRLQRDLAALIAKGGMHRQQAKLASKVAAGVIDDHARSAYRSFPYMWGSTARALNGYTDKKGGYHAPRERFRVWASRKASLKFQVRKSGQTDFWHRSMVKYQNNGKGNPSTLSHLIEFGSFNHQTRRFNRANKIRKASFRARKRQAMVALEKGLALAVQNATAGTKMGLVKFRKTVT